MCELDYKVNLTLTVTQKNKKKQKKILYHQRITSFNTVHNNEAVHHLDQGQGQKFYSGGLCGGVCLKFDV